MTVCKKTMMEKRCRLKKRWGKFQHHFVCAFERLPKWLRLDAQGKHLTPTRQTIHNFEGARLHRGPFFGHHCPLGCSSFWPSFTANELYSAVQHGFSPRFFSPLHQRSEKKRRSFILITFSEKAKPMPTADLAPSSAFFSLSALFSLIFQHFLPSFRINVRHAGEKSRKWKLRHWE